MKLTKISNLMMLGLTLTIAAAGCKTKKPGPITPLNGGMKTPAPVADTGPLPGTGLGSRTPGPGDVPPGNLGVSTTPVVTQPVPPPANPPVEIPKNGLETVPNGKYDNWVQDRDALKSQTAYFDFDKSAIKSSEQSKLDAVADYLKAHPGTAVRVEGNCDERGTEEYNRSLGERRALSAREYLARLGIDPIRVDTITYGEDRPADPGHDESAWAKNRRDEFVVLTAPK